jgi:hypothetical protein
MPQAHQAGKPQVVAFPVANVDVKHVIDKMDRVGIVPGPYRIIYAVSSKKEVHETVKRGKHYRKAVIDDSLAYRLDCTHEGNIRRAPGNVGVFDFIINVLGPVAQQCAGVVAWHALKELGLVRIPEQIAAPQVATIRVCAPTARRGKGQVFSPTLREHARAARAARAACAACAARAAQVGE